MSINTNYLPIKESKNACKLEQKYFSWYINACKNSFSNKVCQIFLVSFCVFAKRQDFNAHFSLVWSKFWDNFLIFSIAFKEILAAYVKKNKEIK